MTIMTLHMIYDLGWSVRRFLGVWYIETLLAEQGISMVNRGKRPLFQGIRLGRSHVCLQNTYEPKIWNYSISSLMVFDDK